MIKKMFTLLLALCLVFSLAACNNSEGQSSEPSTDDVGAFEKPEDYLAVLMASINPQIKMYLADGGVVLEVEAVNEDAKQIVDEILTEGADYKTVIKAFITAANSKGFIKDGATIEFEIVENKNDEMNAENILTDASAVAKDTATELNIALEVVGDENDPTDQTEPSTETTNPPSGNTEQTETHTHTYSKANCTEAAKCSCGVTSGNALGHSWQSATCKAPKTCKTCGATNGSALGHSWQSATCKAPKSCSRCGATEGSKGDHSYVNGTCSVCGATSVLNPKTNLSTKEYVGNFKVSGGDLIGSGIQMSGDTLLVLDRYFTSDPEEASAGGATIVYDGKVYQSVGAGQHPHYYELTDTEIIVKGSYWGDDDPDVTTIRLILQGDGMLKVTYSTNAQFPEGTVLSTNINDVLR